MDIKLKWEAFSIYFPRVCVSLGKGQREGGTKKDRNGLHEGKTLTPETGPDLGLETLSRNR